MPGTSNNTPELRRIEHPATLANILWRFVGVRAVPHLPCRLDCGPSLEMAEDWLALGESEGFAEEMTWLRQLLDTPIQWSALHGIAEIKSPLLKISTATDATPLEYTVRLTGDHYPEAASLPISRTTGGSGSALRAMAARFGLGIESLEGHCGLAMPLAEEKGSPLR